MFRDLWSVMMIRYVKFRVASCCMLIFLAWVELYIPSTDLFITVFYATIDSIIVHPYFTYISMISFYCCSHCFMHGFLHEVKQWNIVSTLTYLLLCFIHVHRAKPYLHVTCIMYAYMNLYITEFLYTCIHIHVLCFVYVTIHCSGRYHRCLYL